MIPGGEKGGEKKKETQAKGEGRSGKPGVFVGQKHKGFANRGKKQRTEGKKGGGKGGVFPRNTWKQASWGGRRPGIIRTGKKKERE